MADKKANKSGVNRALDSGVQSVGSLSGAALLEQELSTAGPVTAKGRPGLRKIPDHFQFPAAGASPLDAKLARREPRKDRALGGVSAWLGTGAVRVEHLEGVNRAGVDGGPSDPVCPAPDVLV